MSAEPLFDAHPARSAPAPPRPSGVIDLGRYRGRAAASGAIAPPTRNDLDAGDGPDRVDRHARSTMATTLSAPVLVPDWDALREPAPEPVLDLTVVPTLEPAAAPATVPPNAFGVEDGELVLRRLRLRSVFTMTLGLTLCAFVVVIGAGVLAWQAISTLGVVENVEALAEDLGWTDVRFDGPALLRSAAIGAGILVVASTFLSVVFAEIFNLLSTITGGLRADVGPPALGRRDRRKIRKALKAKLAEG